MRWLRWAFRCCSLFVATCVAGTVCCASSIDQSLTAGDDLDAVFNDCCAFIAQVYTAGLTGTLAGVSLDITEFQEYNYPLGVQIRPVKKQAPAYPILGEAITNTFGLREIISFRQVIPQVAGTQYALAVHFIGAPPQGPDNAIASWRGAQGDLYQEGYAMASRDYGITWPLQTRDDLHFITYVNTTIPEPSTTLLLSAGLLALLSKRIHAPTSHRSSDDCIYKRGRGWFEGMPALALRSLLRIPSGWSATRTRSGTTQPSGSIPIRSLTAARIQQIPRSRAVPSLSVYRTEAVQNRRLRLVQVRQPQHCFGNAPLPLSRLLLCHRCGPP